MWASAPADCLRVQTNLRIDARIHSSKAFKNAGLDKPSEVFDNSKLETRNCLPAVPFDLWRKPSCHSPAPKHELETRSSKLLCKPPSSLRIFASNDAAPSLFQHT